MSLLTDNGGTKDDLRLPTDENLLTQVRYQCFGTTFLYLTWNLACFKFKSLCFKVKHGVVWLCRSRKGSLTGKILLCRLCPQWVKSRSMLSRISAGKTEPSPDHLFMSLLSGYSCNLENLSSLNELFHKWLCRKTLDLLPGPVYTPEFSFSHYIIALLRRVFLFVYFSSRIISSFFLRYCYILDGKAEIIWKTCAGMRFIYYV